MKLKLLLRIASKVSDLYQAQVFWRKLDRAMALRRRGGIRADGLRVTAARTTLHIEWVAREIHPWDRDLTEDDAERRFTQQCLDDTDAAISRIFNEIPVLDTIEVCVRRGITGPPLLTGTVQRDSLRTSDHVSTGMRLRELGVRFRMNNLRLEEFPGSL
ncbi:MAG: hypothetical protein ACLQU2_15130 [Candidatus Binataceae bacterium]